MADVLLEALGVEDESTGLRAIAELNQFVNELQALFAKKSFGDLQSSIRRTHALAREVEQLTGKSGAEAQGVIMAWKAHAEEHPKLSEENAELKEKVRKDRVDGLIAKGKAAGKITPATVEFWSAQEPDKLEGFLAVAPRAVDMRDRTSVPEGSDNVSTLVHDGKSYGEMKPAERAALAKSDPELFRAMRDDFRANSGGKSR